VVLDQGREGSLGLSTDGPDGGGSRHSSRSSAVVVVVVVVVVGGKGFIGHMKERE